MTRSPHSAEGILTLLADQRGQITGQMVGLTAARLRRGPAENQWPAADDCEFPHSPTYRYWWITELGSIIYAQKKHHVKAINYEAASAANR